MLLVFSEKNVYQRGSEKKKNDINGGAKNVITSSATSLTF